MSYRISQPFRNDIAWTALHKFVTKPSVKLVMELANNQGFTRVFLQTQCSVPSLPPLRDQVCKTSCYPPTDGVNRVPNKLSISVALSSSSLSSGNGSTLTILIVKLVPFDANLAEMHI